MENSHKNGLFTKHQALYKGRTLSWKEAYKERCKQRLKKSRDDVFNKSRSLGDSSVEELMADEWKTMKSENAAAVHMDLEMPEEDFKHVDDTMRIFEEIRQELLKEEQQILAEYESAQSFDEAVASSTLQQEPPDFITCPVCQRSQLFLYKTVILCQCGLRIETEQDCITLAHVKKSLEEGVGHHMESCHGVPSFSVVHQVGVTNLIMTCQSCDFMYIVV